MVRCPAAGDGRILELSRAPDARMGIPAAAALELCGRDSVPARCPDADGRICLCAHDGGTSAGHAAGRAREPGAYSAFRADGFEPALLYRGSEGHGDPIPGDSQEQWRLRHGARCLPDLRRCGIPPTRTECNLPELRRFHLYPLDRRIGWLQSDWREIA